MSNAGPSLLSSNSVYYLHLKMVDNHIRLTYNEIHKLIGTSSAKIQEEFAPDILIAIGTVLIMVFSSNLLTSDSYPH